jgi:glycerol-3-phosphate dehydrogenase subunit B
MARVIVIGKGLAGSMAALAAREKGAEVMCISRAEGRTALSSGLIGAAGGMTADYDVSLNETLTSLLKRRRRHPYLKLEQPYAQVIESLERFASIARERYPEEIADERPAFRVLTEAGSVIPAAIAPRRMARLVDIEGFERIGVLAISGYPAFRAEFLASAWGQALNLDTSFRPIPARFDLDGKPFQQPGTLARYLDDDNSFERFSDSIKSALSDKDIQALLTPPILGLNRPNGAKALGKALDLPVFEVAPFVGPSVPGMRLSALLMNKMTSAHVQHLDAEVLGGIGRNGRIEGLMCRTRNGHEIRHDADAFVLASGKFLGGGIARQNRKLVETIFDLPVMVGGRPARNIFSGKLTKPDVMKSQPISRSGLSVDERFMPLDENGSVVWKNVFAAGQILGGFDPFTDGCSEGVDILSGLIAGAHAAEVTE